MSAPTTDQPANPPGNPPGRRRPMPAGAKLAIAILLLIPMVALALVPTYSKAKPALWGFPFFYWYQLLWVVLTPVFTYAAYLIIVRVRGEKK